MGIVKTIESKKAEIEELRLLLLKSANIGEYKRSERQQHEDEDEDQPRSKQVIKEDDEEEDKLVCVTSGLSYLGLAIVNHLLNLGYSVRIAVDNEEDMDKLREMQILEQTRGHRDGVSAVIVEITDIESLCKAFHGCCGIFHTSAFIDPSGVSGYTKYMAELEVKASVNVIEACARTESVRKCVFTSSLLACVWHDIAVHDLPPVVDHNCWSEESVCRDKKLWFALGKTMAERAAWRMAEDRELKLATICAGFLTGPDFFRRNSTSSIAYLKGAQEMYAEGLLATTDVSKVAEAHVCVYEALRSTACGRYICFDSVIQTEEEAFELAGQMEMPQQRISGNLPNDSHAQSKLCNRKLLRLMSRQSRCT
ncbi:Cinnamoyl-coa reductase [Thalictrum thalictroides]|uniref:Cinnamoyl-coa reductase n=1 Tax=Thalictrum thalictroides TaxID=46969 RepID=A0A7J6W1H0_THATH|nr:Cinnamoyl-coa reductase [Thalictrum thalictroides]